MNLPKVSIKKGVLTQVTIRGWIWISVLYVCSVIFYIEFFRWAEAIFLGGFITFILVGMMLVGYVHLGPRKKFPLWRFTLWVALFSIVRYSYIFFFLHQYMPEYTIFHYVDRVVPTVLFTSASLLFLGYNYAIYEWGLAAREKYKNIDSKAQQDYEQPIVIRANGANVYLLPQEITHIHANGEYVDYHTVERKYTVFKRLKQVETTLKAYGFKRCHRSYIANVSHIKSVSATNIVLSSGVTLPISKTYKESFTSSF